MKKKDQKIFLIVMVALVIIAFFFFQSSDTILGSLIEPYTKPNWDEVPEKHIVKSSIPIILLEGKNGICKMTAQKFNVIIEHPYFIRGNELAEELNYDKEDETIILSCDLVELGKSKLNVWYAVEESSKHSKKYQYFITPWNETQSD
jgi:hypothetical protein